MALTATYETTLSRVKLVASGLSEDGDYATIERSTNGYHWTTVRGAVELPIGAGGTVTHYDYEFDPGEENFYRIRSIYDSDTLRIGTGDVGGAGDNASINLTLSPDTEAGDLILIAASIRNAAATVNTPAGYTRLAHYSDHVALFGKIATASESNPTVTFSGGAAGDTTLAQTKTLRGPGITVHSSLSDAHSGLDDIDFDQPAVGLPGRWTGVLLGWKADDFTSAATPGGWVAAGQQVSTLGTDAGQVVFWSTGSGTNSSFTGLEIDLTGGGTTDSAFVMVFLPHADYLTEFSTSITPTPTMPWLKSVTRPFLNTEVTVGDWSSISASARGALFQVVGRSAPVAVSDVRGPRSFQIEIQTNGESERTRLRYLLAGGDVLLLQPPADSDCDLPEGYYWVNSYSEERRARRTERRVFSLDVTLCAAPGADVAAFTATWNSIIASFGTWADVLAAFPTWSDVMEYVADPSVVYIP